MITYKTPDEIALMRESGRILREILHALATSVKIGIATEEIDNKAAALMAEYNVDSSFKGYRGYPKVTCISVNEEIVHAIPGRRTIDDGDLVKIDCGVIYKGYHSDAAVAVLVGNVSPEVRIFAETVQKAIDKGIASIKPGARMGDLGFAVQSVIQGGGYSIVEDFIGHGIGRAMHEEPEVPNWGSKGKGIALVPGMVIAIEPIVAMGKRFSDLQKDGWTAVTRDGSIACQIEHTVAITPSGCEVLTNYNGTTKNLYTQ